MAKAAQSADPEVVRLVEAVLRSRKYARVLPGLVASIGRRELERRARLADAIQATRRQLHQVIGACLPAPRFADWCASLEAAADGDPLRAAARAILAAHTSTRERLPELERFWRELDSELRPGARVLDLGCGMQPLALLWLSRARELDYRACDVDLDLVDFLNAFFARARLPGRAFACDLSRAGPPDEVDVALLLKVLPALDRLDASAGTRLLRSLRAPRLVVSFPTASLGGKARGMRESAARRVESLVAGEPWRVARAFSLDAEQVYVLDRL